MQMLCALAATLLLTLGSASSFAQDLPVARDAPARSAVARIDVRLRDLSAVRRLLSSFARQQLSEGDRAAALGDVSVLVDAITGHTADASFRYDDLLSSATT